MHIFYFHFRFHVNHNFLLPALSSYFSSLKLCSLESPYQTGHIGNFLCLCYIVIVMAKYYPLIHILLLIRYHGNEFWHGILYSIMHFSIL